MKRYLKNYALTVGDVEAAIYDCLKHKWRRKDVSYFLAEYMKKDGDDIHKVARYCRKIAYHKQTRYLLYDTVSRAAVKLYEEIINRKIELKPIDYQIRYDATSEKMREIGIASIKQQVYDYVAVNACKEMFMAKIGYYQVASIRGKGQIFGKKAIERWLRIDKQNTRWHWKCDIKKYYPSVNKRVLKRMLRRDIKDDDIIYILYTLIDTYKSGLCIGSYLSQFLANYYLSYAYHYVTEFSYYIRVRKNGERVRINHSKHVLFYMDDIIIFSNSLKLLKKAVKDFEWYIEEKLGLTIKPDSCFYKTAEHAVDMMGFVISNKNTILRKRIYKKIFRLFYRLKRRIEKLSLHISRRIISYTGWLKYSDLYWFIKKFDVIRHVNRAKKVIRYYDKRNFYRETRDLQLLSA